MKIYKTTQLTLLIATLIFLDPGNVMGQLQYNWAHQGGGAGLDQGYDIAVDPSGNVYTTGVYEGDAVFTHNPQTGDTLFHTVQSDAFISKYDANGNYQWAIRLIGHPSSPANQNQIPYAIAVDDTGNVYITGRMDSPTDFDPSEAPGDTLYLQSDSGTAFIAKYNPNGQLVWARNFGGQTHVQGNAIKIGSTGDIFLHGYFNGTADFDPSPAVQSATTNGGYDFYVARYTSQGNLVWVNTFGSTGSDFAVDMELGAGDSIFVAARFSNTVDLDPGTGTHNLTSAGGEDPVIAKFSQNGDLVWAFNIEGPNTEYIFDLAVDNNSNIAVTGYINAATDFDPNGTMTLTPVGGQDAFLAHYDGNGNLNWAINPSNSNNDAGSAVSFNTQGEVFLTGTFDGTIDLDPSAASANFTANQNDIYVGQYSASGNFLWAGVMGGSNFDFANASTTDGADNLYLTGGFMGPADFNPDTSAQAVDNLAGLGSFDVFTIKLDAEMSCPAVTVNLAEDVCTGDSLLFGGDYLTQAGTYYDTLQTTMGCDSILIMQLGVLQGFTTTTSAEFCEGDSVLFAGQYYGQSGTYYDSLTTVEGCDSVFILQLTRRTPGYGTVDTTIAQGDSILINNNYVSNAGHYQDTLSVPGDCDSIVTWIVNVSIGIEYPAFASVEIWPNPSTGNVHIAGVNEQIQVQLYDLQGRLLKHHEISTDTTFDWNDMAEGIYFLHMEAPLKGTKRIMRLVLQ